MSVLDELKRLAGRIPPAEMNLARLRELATSAHRIYGQEGDPDPATMSDEALQAAYGPESVREAMDGVYGEATNWSRQ
jgi:hypothetical protein